MVGAKPIIAIMQQVPMIQSIVTAIGVLHISAIAPSSRNPIGAKPIATIFTPIDRPRISGGAPRSIKTGCITVNPAKESPDASTPHDVSRDPVRLLERRPEDRARLLSKVRDT